MLLDRSQTQYVAQSVEHPEFTGFDALFECCMNESVFVSFFVYEVLTMLIQ